jgi:gas vesicle protein
MSEPLHSGIEEEQDDGSNRFAWFLTGAIIGLTVAMLYAPKSGKQTREFLSEKTQQGKDAVTEGGREILDAGRDMFERGRKLVEDAADLFERGRRLMRD